MLVLTVNKPLPSLARVTTEDVGEARVEFNLIFVQILVQLFSPEHLGNPHQLVVVIMPDEEDDDRKYYLCCLPMKERLLPEDHRSQHAAQTPHVETVVVHLVVHQQLGALDRR